MSKAKPRKSASKSAEKQQLIEPTLAAAIMQIIQAESDKAMLSVPHMLSLGQLRERIFRRAIIETMPRKVSIDTGLITHTEFDVESQKYEARHSKQIDLLLHDHFNYATLYQLDDFVVCSLEAALAGIEIKTSLNRLTFSEMVGVNLSIRDLTRAPAVDGFGYALNGVGFSTFRKLVTDALRDPKHWKHRLATLPVGICCQDQNYICLRPSPKNDKNEKHFAFCARPRREIKGWALMIFIQVLRLYAANELRSERSDRLPLWILSNWYNDLDFKQFEKYHVDANGDWLTGEFHVPPVLFRD